MGRQITVGRGGGRFTPPVDAEAVPARPSHRLVQVGLGRALQEQGIALNGIDADAAALLDRYWTAHPDIYQEERQEHGVDPVAAPLVFWRGELAEPEHADIRAIVERDGIMHLAAAEAWIPEEDVGDDDEEYRALLDLARGPLPDLDDSLPDSGLPPEFTSDVTRTLRELTASGQQQTGETVRDALAAVGIAHRQTMEAVREVLTAAAAGQKGGSSDALTIAALGVLDDFARRPAPPAPVVHVHTPKHDLNVHVDTPEINPTFTVEAPPPAEVSVDVHMPEQQPPQVTVNTPAPLVQAAAAPVVNVTVPDTQPKKPSSVRVEYDDNGFKHFVPVMDGET